jgi:hypothetical protein
MFILSRYAAEFDTIPCDAAGLILDCCNSATIEGFVNCSSFSQFCSHTPPQFVTNQDSGGRRLLEVKASKSLQIHHFKHAHEAQCEDRFHEDDSRVCIVV